VAPELAAASTNGTGDEAAAVTEDGAEPAETADGAAGATDGDAEDEPTA
jgi:hypothetical protein